MKLVYHGPGRGVKKAMTARDTSAAVERLNEIWGAWSLGQALDLMLMKAQREALTGLVLLLDQGGAATVLRAAQALLADPDRPGVVHRALFKTLWTHLDNNHWIGAGSKPDDVQQLQAMLLAAWPRERRTDGFGLLPMLASPLDVMQGREKQQKHLEQWWEEAVWAEQNGDGQEQEDEENEDEENEDEENEDEENENGKSASFIERIRQTSIAFEQPVSVLKQHAGQNHYSHVGPSILLLMEKLAGSLGKEIPGAFEQHRSELQQSRAQGTISLQRTSELLWWGQARYCHTLRKPFRRIGDADSCLWWAAREAAERAAGLHIESAAAYLHEVLHGLGHDMDESQPLQEWMSRLHAYLARAEAPAPASVCEPLADLASKDALGLPVTWVRLHADSQLDLEQAAEDIALPLDATINRGQWAAWVFRELLLDGFFAGVA